MTFELELDDVEVVETFDFELALDGRNFQLLDDTLFCFKKTSLSKLLSDKLDRFGTKTSPAVLNNRSQAADDGSAMLYSLSIVNSALIIK